MPSDQGVLAEVDGNRTRRTGIARPNRFEGGGAHQVPGHLPAAQVYHGVSSGRGILLDRWEGSRPDRWVVRFPPRLGDGLEEVAAERGAQGGE